MNEWQRAALVVAILVLGLVVSYFVFLRPYLSEEHAVEQVRTARSTWTVTMQQYLFTGPLSAQTYRISNDDGKVTMFFSATNRDGTVTKQFNVPLTGPQATFLFEMLRAEGIWELPGKPMRESPHDEYIFYVAQTLGNEGGNRAFGFSDPVYWAMTKSHEYTLNLKNPDNPVAAGGRPLREPRYLKLVELVESFGPESVQQAEAEIRSELAATNSHPVGVTQGAR